MFRFTIYKCPWIQNKIRANITKSHDRNLQDKDKSIIFSDETQKKN